MLEFAFWVECSLTLRFNLTVSQLLRQASHFLARPAASWLLGLSGLNRANSLWTSRTIKNNYNNKNNNNNNITIRSQPYAFSVDGSSGELVAAGGTETETQVMIVTMMKTMMVMVWWWWWWRRRPCWIRWIWCPWWCWWCWENIVPGLDEEHQDKAMDFSSSGRNPHRSRDSNSK